MFWRSQFSFALKLLVLEFVFNPRILVVDNQEVGSVITCIIPECDTTTLSCLLSRGLSEEDIEWLNPSNVVINSTSTNRIYKYAGFVTITNPQVTDSGIYTCRAKANHSDYDEVTLIIRKRPSFVFGNNIYEEKIAQRYNDVFINCSVDPIDASTSWDFENIRINDLNDNDKYSQNISGLTIYNVTEEDQGYYVCFLDSIDPLFATILLDVVWTPQLLLPQNKTVEVNVSEEVTLNCTASSSPDPVYTWSIPDSCSSCPKFNNDSVMIFTVDISKSGDYICIAQNDYGTDIKQITINVLSKPLLATESETIIMKESNDIVLTCNVQYAYPLPTIKWYIMTSLSDNYTLIHQNTTDYKLLSNGSVEFLYRFLFEMGYMSVMCSATNVYGYEHSTFILWEYNTFIKKQEFKVYVDNITKCEDLEEDKDLFSKLVDSLRKWFDSACKDHCNGHNNLFTPQLTCLDDHVGVIDSVVHHEGECSAQMLINRAIADVQNRKPPIVHLSHGWILRLNLTSPEQIQSSDNNHELLPTVVKFAIGIAIAVVILLLIVAGVICGMHKRRCSHSKTTGNSNNSNDIKAHRYDEVGNYVKSGSVCKDDVIFEASASQMPAYQSLSKFLDDSCTNKTKNEKLYNEYYIDGEDNSKFKNVCRDEKYLKNNFEKELQNDNTYNKLVHLKQ